MKIFTGIMVLILIGLVLKYGGQASKLLPGISNLIVSMVGAIQGRNT